MTDLNIEQAVSFKGFLKRKNKSDYEQRYAMLKGEIGAAKQELDNAFANFNTVTDPELIDLWIYQIKSAQAKYGHLIQKAKNFI